MSEVYKNFAMLHLGLRKNESKQLFIPRVSFAIAMPSFFMDMPSFYRYALKECPGFCESLSKLSLLRYSFISSVQRT